MQQLRRLGAFVGSHMPFIVPVCVACGVLVPQVFIPFKAAVPYLFALITFQGSLNTTIRQVAHTFRHPRELLAILICSIAVMPALAFAASWFMFGDAEIVAGAVIEYSIPVAVVSFMWIDMFHGNASLGLAAILTSTVLSPFTIPLTLHVLMGATVAVDSASMMVDMLFMIALPAIAGVALNELTGGWGHEGLSPNLSPVCRILTVFVITCNSTGISPYVLSMDAVVLKVALFIFVFASMGFVLGIVVARLLHAPTPDMLSMCFCTGMRNISSGAVIATQFFPGAAIIPVMMGTLFQQMLAAVCGQVLQRLLGEERERGHRRVLTARALQRKSSRGEDS